MTQAQILIDYPANLPALLHTTLSAFAAEAKMAMAVKLFELKHLSSGMASQLAGVDRVTFPPVWLETRWILAAFGETEENAVAQYAQTYSDRNGAIAAAYASGGYTMQEIGDYFGLHYSWISKILQREVQEKAKEKRKT